MGFTDWKKSKFTKAKGGRAEAHNDRRKARSITNHEARALAAKAHKAQRKARRSILPGGRYVTPHGLRCLCLMGLGRGKGFDKPVPRVKHGRVMGPTALANEQMRKMERREA